MKATKDINQQLHEFRNKRLAGLGEMFGPKDEILEECVENKALEIKTIEDVLEPHIKKMA